MRIALTCLTTLLAATTVAAEPKPEEDIERVSYTTPAPKPKPTPEWVELATPTPARNGIEYIPIAKSAGRFSQLRIDASRGVVYVYEIAIQYADGKQQTIRLDRRLDAKHPISVDVTAGKPIDTIVVKTDRDSNGSYGLFGTHGQGGVARR